MADSEQKANALIAEAEKKLNSKGFLGGIFGWDENSLFGWHIQNIYKKKFKEV